MLGVAVRKQQSIETIDAAAVEKRLECTLVTAPAATINKPIVTVGTSVRGRARAFIQNSDCHGRTCFGKPLLVNVTGGKTSKEMDQGEDGAR